MGLLVIIILALLSADLHAAEADSIAPLIGPSPRVLSFHQWKDGEITQATNRLVRAENKLIMAQKRKTSLQQRDEYQREVDKCSKAVEITKDFTIEDYFLVYLSKFSHSGIALREAAKVLSDEEIAQLMKVFLRSQRRGAGKAGSAWISSFNHTNIKKL